MLLKAAVAVLAECEGDLLIQEAREQEAAAWPARICTAAAWGPAVARVVHRVVMVWHQSPWLAARHPLAKRPLPPSFLHPAPAAGF